MYCIVLKFLISTKQHVPVPVIFVNIILIIFVIRFWCKKETHRSDNYSCEFPEYSSISLSAGMRFVGGGGIVGQGCVCSLWVKWILAQMLQTAPIIFSDCSQYTSGGGRGGRGKIFFDSPGLDVDPHRRVSLHSYIFLSVCFQSHYDCPLPAAAMYLRDLRIDSYQIWHMWQ